MPELPDLTVYLERIEAHAGSAALRQLRIGNPFVLRTVEPRREVCAGARPGRLTSYELAGPRLMRLSDSGVTPR